VSQIATVFVGAMFVIRLLTSPSQRIGSNGLGANATVTL